VYVTCVGGVFPAHQASALAELWRRQRSDRRGWADAGLCTTTRPLSTVSRRVCGGGCIASPPHVRAAVPRRRFTTSWRCRACHRWPPLHTCFVRSYWLLRVHPSSAGPHPPRALGGRVHRTAPAAVRRSWRVHLTAAAHQAACAVCRVGGCHCVPLCWEGGRWPPPAPSTASMHCRRRPCTVRALPWSPLRHWTRRPSPCLQSPPPPPPPLSPRLAALSGRLM